MGAVTLFKDNLYWGEGMHEDKKSSLFIFDLKNKKLVKKVPVDGHIERAIFVDAEQIVAGIGPGGVLSLTHDLKVKWSIKESNHQKLHVDSNFVTLNQKLCFASIYSFKGILCIEPSSGKVDVQIELDKNPKSEITSFGDTVIGYATDGDLVNPNFTLSSRLYEVNVKSKKLTVDKVIPGYNFFAPLILDDRAVINLSNGDIMMMRLSDSEVQSLGNFKEPFVNNAFSIGKYFCSLSIGGKLVCFEQREKAYQIVENTKVLEAPIGKIIANDKQAIAPSRKGFFTIDSPKNRN
jgi:hypothetical protein